MRLYDFIAVCALFVVVGIFSAQYGLPLGYLAMFVLVAAILIYAKHKKSRFCLAALFLIVGFFYSALYVAYTAPRIAFDETASYAGKVASDVHESPDSAFFSVALDAPHRGTVTVYTKQYYAVAYGDSVSFDGKTNRLGNALVVYAEKISVTESAGWSLFSALYAFKRAAIECIERALPQKQATLAVGLLFGESGGFSGDFKDELSKSGTMHIVALSGYNIMLIAGILYGIAGAFFKRRTAFASSIIGITLFVCMVGASPSVLRAAIMGIMMLYATEFGRNYMAPIAMLYAALGMLLYNPTSATNVGFQLSFCALAGLIYFEKPFRFLLNPKNINGFMSWRKNLVQTCAAQLGVLPILIISFNAYSVRSIFANLLIMETIPLAMLFSFITAMLGFVSYYSSVICAMIAYIFLWYETGIIHLFGSW